MERYEEYKYSGVDWIGDIPVGWKIWPLKYLSYNYKAGPFGSSLITSSLLSEGTCLVYTPEHVATARFDSDKNLYLPETRKEEMAQFAVKPDDVVFPIVGSLGRAIMIQPEMPHGILNQRLAKYCLDERLVDPRFFMWLFGRSEFYSPYIAIEQRGSIIVNLTKAIVGNMPVPLPSASEQAAIADYLDAKTAEIDALVADCEREVGLLREYRKAVISEAVTKGLDPDAPMKDSGVEWIGEIPERWNTARLGEVSYIRARLGWRALKAEEYVDEGYPMYSAFNIVNEKFVAEPVNYITEYRYLESPEIMMAVGDIMLVKDGAGVGKCAVIRELDGPCTVNGSIALITPDESQDSRYLYYFFESNAFQHFSRMLMGGMGVPHLFQRDIKLMRVIQPDQEMQTLIANYLDAKTAEIDSLIDAKQSMADKLREYRKSLISEAVTGKFKVPGV